MEAENLLERLEKLDALIPSDPKSFLENLTPEEYLAEQERSKFVSQELKDIGKALFAAIDRELLATKAQA